MPWSQYVELRKVEREQQAAAAKDQQRYIKETTDLINKFRAKASKAAFAQNLINKLDKLERIEVEDEDLRKMLVKFPPAPNSGKIVCEVPGVSKAYDQKRIFSNAELTIAKGEHLALVGANGTGKSTLVRMIMNEEPYDGEIRLGHNVIIGYYAQDMPERMSPLKHRDRNRGVCCQRGQPLARACHARRVHVQRRGCGQEGEGAQRW